MNLSNTYKSPKGGVFCRACRKINRKDAGVNYKQLKAESLEMARRVLREK